MNQLEKIKYCKYVHIFVCICQYFPETSEWSSSKTWDIIQVGGFGFNTNTLDLVSNSSKSVWSHGLEDHDGHTQHFQPLVEEDIAGVVLKRFHNQTFQWSSPIDVENNQGSTEFQILLVRSCPKLCWFSRVQRLGDVSFTPDRGGNARHVRNDKGLKSGVWTVPKLEKNKKPKKHEKTWKNTS